MKQLLNTLFYLKPSQVFYQIKLRLIRKRNLDFYGNYSKLQNIKLLFFQIKRDECSLEIINIISKFKFLNLSHSISGKIIWNFQRYGKLWNYNLQYLDFLRQSDISIDLKVKLIFDIYNWLKLGKLSLEPYPVSLRIMNIIRFLETNFIAQEELNIIRLNLSSEINYLSKNLEYHILANHLLENSFALWMGGNYFSQAQWMIKAEQLLKAELREQVLPDGAHFELAPMYHQIILFRVLEAYYLTSDTHSLKSILKEKAELMLGWLQQMSFANGTLPHFNDTTEGISQSPNELLSIGKLLGIKGKKVKLKESGYRVFQFHNLKLIADVEGIKPSYQPGHAHADTFSFVLHEGIIPVIVDPGISTYNISQRRDWERSTRAHNTLTIDDKNSSDVWAGFRVGRRAKVKIRKDTEFQVEGIHNGFFPALHSRTFQIENSGISVIDEVSGDISPESQKVIRFYLHPTIQPELIDTNSVRMTSSLNIQFIGSDTIEFSSYDYCQGFNLLKKALVIVVTLKEKSIKSLFINK